MRLLSDEGTAVSATAQTVSDKAGNVSDPSNVVTVSIDKTDPGINWAGGMNGGDSFYFGSVPGRADLCSYRCHVRPGRLRGDRVLRRLSAPTL